MKSMVMNRLPGQKNRTTRYETKSYWSNWCWMFQIPDCSGLEACCKF